VKLTLNVEQTDPGDLAVELWIGAPFESASVLLTPTQYAELITDGIRRLALIRGRRAAVEAVTAADTEPGERHPLSAAERPADPLSGVLTPGNPGHRADGAGGAQE